ncbi:MAG: hypothetical protein R6V27_05340 [Balneolaceae bacterium]
MKAITTFLLALFITIPVLVQGQSEPPSGMNELQAYSVFVDAYRSEDYEMAMNYGEWIIEAAPKEIEGYDEFELERQFDRMISIYAGAAEEEEDPSLQTEYLEKAAGVFDKAEDTFSDDEIDEYDWELKEGRFYHENRENMDASMDDAIRHYFNAFELDAEQFTQESDGFYAEVLLTELAREGERDRAFQMIENIEEMASGQLQSTIDDVRESLFENPGERIEYYESQLTEVDDAEKERILNDLVDLYEEVGSEEKAREAAVELYELNDNLENTRAVADINISAGEYRSAVDYLLEAEELAEDEDTRFEIFLQLAETYQQVEEFEDSREYARKAIDLDENSGEAYLRMASLYAGTVSGCVNGSKLEREDRAVYWLVLDYLDQARAADSSVESEAQNREESYVEAMPSDEDKFFNEWEAGDSFQINGDLKDCYAWINETTTVR